MNIIIQSSSSNDLILDIFNEGRTAKVVNEMERMWSEMNGSGAPRGGINMDKLPTDSQRLGPFPK